jgi:hypothetical protein
LRGLQRFAEGDEAGGGARGKIERVEEAQGKCDGRDDGDDADEVNRAHTAGAHGGDFAVGCEAGEAEKDADEHGHGDGDGEGWWEGKEDDTSDVSHGGGVADDELEDTAEVAHEDNKGKEGSAEKGVRGDFAEDVAGDDAHFVYCFVKTNSSVSRTLWLLVEREGVTDVARSEATQRADRYSILRDKVEREGFARQRIVWAS